MNIPIRVGLSPTLHIRGLLATEDIKQNQIIERCPIVLVAMRDLAHVDRTVLTRYYFEWNKRYSAMVLGYGSLYNHSFTPNVRYCHNYREQWLIFKARRDIAAGEELLINYLFESTNEAELSQYFTDFDPHRKTVDSKQKAVRRNQPAESTRSK